MISLHPSVLQRVLYHMKFDSNATPNRDAIEQLLRNRLSNFDTLDAVAPIAEPGCSNHVFAIACTMRDGNNISYKEFVLKVCKTERNSIKTLNEVNVLRALCSILPPQHQKFPRVVAFEHDTSRSEIGAAYILMERISGVRLTTIWKTLSERQRESIIDQLAELLANIRTKFVFSKIGNFASTISFVPEGKFVLCPGKLIWLEFNNASESQSHSASGPFQSTFHYLEALLLQHLKNLNLTSDSQAKQIERYIHQLLDKLRMISAFQVPDEEFVLTHGDLNATNILVAELSNGDVKISGIVDWEFSGSFPEEYEFENGFGWLHSEPNLRKRLLANLEKFGSRKPPFLTERHDLYLVERNVARLDSNIDVYSNKSTQEVLCSNVMKVLESVLSKYAVDTC